MHTNTWSKSHDLAPGIPSDLRAGKDPRLAASLCLGTGPRTAWVTAPLGARASRGGCLVPTEATAVWWEEGSGNSGGPAGV